MGIIFSIIITCIALLFTWGLPLVKYIEPEWDFSNWETMVIELSVGVVAGGIIAYKIHWDNEQKKEKRGRTITLALLDYLIPLRYNVREFIQTIEKESEEHYRIIDSKTADEYKKRYDNIRENRLKINSLLYISGDSIDETHQMMLTRVVDILEIEIAFDIQESVLIVLYQLESEITRYLKSNKKAVKISLNLKNAHSEEKLQELTAKRSLSKGEEKLKGFYENNIKRNNDYVEDILTD